MLLTVRDREVTASSATSLDSSLWSRLSSNCPMKSSSKQARSCFVGCGSAVLMLLTVRDRLGVWASCSTRAWMPASATPVALLLLLPHKLLPRKLLKQQPLLKPQPSDLDQRSLNDHPQRLPLPKLQQLKLQRPRLLPQKPLKRSHADDTRAALPSPLMTGAPTIVSSTEFLCIPCAAMKPRNPSAQQICTATVLQAPRIPAELVLCLSKLELILFHNSYFVIMIL